MAEIVAEKVEFSAETNLGLEMNYNLRVKKR